MPNLVFNPKNYSLENLINDIDIGNIALPDLQRPFVWETKKSRDLIDSLYKGLPVGLIIIWEILESNSHRNINLNAQRIPRFLVIDGQQRLTSLYSIIKSKEIISRNVKKFKIKIAFNPIEEKFEVSNPFLSKNPEWIDDISKIFNGNLHSLINEYFNRFNNKQNNLEEIFFESNNFEKNQNFKDKNIVEVISDRLYKVKNILNYPFSVLELSTELDPEEVSEIFVRINSKGQTLNQSDFILTLMSVYWPEGRKQLEDFCLKTHKIPDSNEASSFNIINLKPTPAYLIRTIVGLAFGRGRLKYAYLILKGRDFENRIINQELRKQNFEVFKKAQNIALDLTNWHDFVKIIYSSGFVNENLISSLITLYITYSFYLIGKDKYKDNYKEFESVIKKWFVFSILTQRYTGSSESQIEQDLNRIHQSNLLDFVNKNVNLRFTEDFWNSYLPAQLESSSTRNYIYLTYLASQINFDYKVLFSDIKLRDYFNPFLKEKKKTIDLHHIFPKNYLIKKFNLNQKQYNQVANLIHIEYKDNIKISDKSPFEYWNEFIKNYSDEDIKNLYEVYDLPENFYNMDYNMFLQERRKLMALKIKKYFYKL